MKDREVNCQQCGSPMHVVKKLSNGVSDKGTEYRRRRFRCDICDFEEMINADGYKDIIMEPFISVDEANEVLSIKTKSNEIKKRKVR